MKLIKLDNLSFIEAIDDEMIKKITAGGPNIRELILSFLPPEPQGTIGCKGARECSDFITNNFDNGNCADNFRCAPTDEGPVCVCDP